MGRLKWHYILSSFFVILSLLAAGACDGTVPPDSGLPVIDHFNADPDEVTANDNAVLCWSVSGASTVTIEPDIGDVALSGDLSVRPHEDTTYILTASNEEGSVTARTQVIGYDGPLASTDVSLYINTAGDPNSGNVLIALSGGPGFSSHYVEGLERLAGPEFAVVTFDQRGTGRSASPPEKVSSYKLLKYVSDLESVRETVAAESVHLLGHSWGGIVAMRYATIYPERVRSMVLVGSGPPTWEGIWEGYSRFQERVQELQQTGIIPQNLQQEGATLPAYFSDPSFFFSPDDGREPEFSYTVNQLTLSAIEGYDLRKDLVKLNHQVLIIWGEDDPFGLPMAEATYNALSNADVELVILESCGHFWQECPDEFLSHIRRFLDLQ